MPTSKLHEKILKDTIKELTKQGYRVIDLEMKSPDAIATKNNKIYAVEVLGLQYRGKKGWNRNWTYRAKKSIYHMFDDLIVKTFKYPKK